MGFCGTGSAMCDEDPPKVKFSIYIFHGMIIAVKPGLNHAVLMILLIPVFLIRVHPDRFYEIAVHGELLFSSMVLVS